jgi:glycine hydroxymethyltransferase
MMDVFQKGMTGQKAEEVLGEAGIAVNKNTIPFDTNPPMKASGLRLGTPSVSTRGMREPEMAEIGNLVADILESSGGSDVMNQARMRVLNLCRRFPFYQALAGRFTGKSPGVGARG